uniref:DinB family protein n=1 Tax=Acidobacterium capsulatum TaxID=33075 RepID=A0A7V5CRV5_9BACT
MPTHDHLLRDTLIPFLRGQGAHADLTAAVKDFPAEHYGTRPPGLPHSAWELLEHIRFTLHDLINFCTNPEYTEPEWSADYWPKNPAPQHPEDWQRTVTAIQQDMEEFEKLMSDPRSNLYSKIPWGDGQTLLREVLLAADHTSYHTGQIILVRQLLGIWK